ncbi:MAG: tetratricopeptide repeat protein [Gemmatimonadota bacterium]
MKVRTWIAIAALVGVTACGGDEPDGQRVPLDQPQQEEDARADWPEGLGEQVDAANTAYGEGRYEDAATMYREMTAEHPDIGTLWFGLYLSETALGNQEAADSALVRVEELVPGLLQMHDEAEMEGPTGQMPRDSIHRSMMQDDDG